MLFRPPTRRLPAADVPHLAIWNPGTGYGRVRPSAAIRCLRGEDWYPSQSNVNGTAHNAPDSGVSERSDP